jgi:hypothetical protein
MGSLVPNRWQRENGKLLELTLIHELGHVFGLQHDGETIMSESGPAVVVSWPFGYAFVDNGTNPSVFATHFTHPRRTHSSLTGDFFKSQGALLGVPEGYNHLELQPDESKKSFLLFAAPNAQASLELIGTFTKGATGGRSTYGQMASIFLTQKQKVFPLAVKPEGQNLEFHALTEDEQAMWYQREGQEGRRHMVFSNRPSQLSITAVNDKNEIEMRFLELTDWDWDLSKIPGIDPQAPSRGTLSAAKHPKIPKFFPLPINGKGWPMFNQKN